MGYTVLRNIISDTVPVLFNEYKYMYVQMTYIACESDSGFSCKLAMNFFALACMFILFYTVGT